MGMKNSSKRIRGTAMMMAICFMASGTSFAATKSTLTSFDKAILSKNTGYFIEKKAMADVTGDGKSDTVYLLAHKFDKIGDYRDHFRLAVLNGATHQWTQTSLSADSDGGYNAELTLADIQGSKAKEILLVAPNGGSGGYVNFVAYTYEGKKFRLLLDSEQSTKQLEITGKFKDDYKVDVDMNQLNKHFELNVIDRKPFYEEGAIYIKGKLAPPQTPSVPVAPWGGGPDQITLKNNLKTGRQDVLWHTVVKGVANADSLAEVTVTWTDNGQTLKPTDVQLKQMYTVDTELMTLPASEIQSISIKSGTTTSALTLASPATKALIKKLSAVQTTPVFYPSELQRQESDPKYIATITYKDGSKDLIKTTETGEFTYRTLDTNGSWAGAKCEGLSEQIELALKMTAKVNLGPHITGINSESKPNKALEKVIIAKLGIPKESLSKTRYYYNYVDLNHDGHDEIFAVVIGSYTSGTGGDTGLIVVPTTTSGYQVNQVFTLINEPVIISDQITHGTHEIITMRSGGGATPNYVALTCHDGFYTTVNKGRIIKNISTVSGTAILCDDVAKDFEKGTGLFLSDK